MESEQILIKKDNKIILLKDSREIKKWGSGAGILLPKELIGKKVRIIFDERIAKELKNE